MKNTLSVLSLILVIVGALNWLLIGIFNLDFVALLFGDMSVGARIVYTVVGAAGIWMFLFLFRKQGNLDREVAGNKKKN